jgi:hypothetical protein
MKRPFSTARDEERSEMKTPAGCQAGVAGLLK